MHNRAKARGLTIIGFLLVAAVAVIFIAVGARMVPAYIEFYSVQRSLEKSLADAKDPTSHRSTCASPSPSTSRRITSTR